MHIVGVTEPCPDEPALHPTPAANLDVVSWEHKGYGDTAVASVYASKRRHRARTIPVAGFPYGALWQELDATPYRGARVRLRGKLRTASPGRGQLWMRVDRGNAAAFTDNMNDRPVVSRTWETAEIVGTVGPDATRIVFGTVMSGSGTVWYDDLELAVQTPGGAWSPLAIKDPGFEAGSPLASWKPGLARPSAGTLDGWRVSADHDRPASGSASLRVEPVMHVVDDELFADAPQPGETVDVDLGDGLRARVPIALYSKGGQTIGDDPTAAGRWQAGEPAITQARFDAIAAIADVIAEPTGCSSVFTGLRVTKLDGGRFHLIGIQPTIPVVRTIDGIAAGRDEVLEKALVFVRTGIR